MDAHLSLIEKLEKCTGPGRELDARIWLLVGDELGSEWSLNGTEPIRPRKISNGRHMESALDKYPDDINGICLSWRVPLFSSSIDAALTLIPEGRKWRVGSHTTPIWDGFHAAIYADKVGDILAGQTHEGWCKSTPAIALCIASLRARSAA